MTPELITLIGKRMTRPAAAQELMNLHKALATNSPMVGSRYARAMECSGALENPATTSEEREKLLAALTGDTSNERTTHIRIRLSDAEKAALQQLAANAGESVSAYVRRTCGL